MQNKAKLEKKKSLNKKTKFIYKKPKLNNKWKYQMKAKLIKKKKWLDIKRNHKIRNESIFLKIEIKKRNNKTIK